MFFPCAIFGLAGPGRLPGILTGEEPVCLHDPQSADQLGFMFSLFTPAEIGSYEVHNGLKFSTIRDP